MSLKLINVREQHAAYKVPNVFDGELVVMHPSSEIVSSLFLFREKARQHMQGIGTSRFKQAIESAAGANFEESPSSLDRKPLRFILAMSLSIWSRSLLSVYPHHAGDAYITYCAIVVALATTWRA